MMSYVLKRMMMTIPTILLVAVVVFSLMRLIPGDPAMVLLGETENPEALADAQRRLGLDRPYPVQFWLWLTAMLKGDLGRSFITDDPVLGMILKGFAVTVQVTLPATLLAAFIAVPLGLLAALKQNRPLDGAVVFTSVLLLSLPSFWVGLVLILVLGVWLGWLPFIGWVSVFDGGFQGLAYLIMPVCALTLTEIATIARMARASTIDVLRLEYISHARAKGLSEAAVLWRHAFPNAFGPTLTFIGLVLGSLLSGAAVTETVFTLPGLGRLLVEAIYARDYPVVQGCLLFIALLYVFINLVVDLLYPLFDPRVTL